MSGRILIPYPRLSAIGGGNGVTAWALQTLAEAGHEVHLASLWQPDFGEVDRIFGTGLATRPPHLHLAPARYRRLLHTLPVPAGFLEMALLERWTAILRRRTPYDLLFSTHNEMRLPARGLQYVHYPRFRRQRPDTDYRWYHLPALTRVYRSLANRIGGTSLRDWRDNLALCNSSFIEQLYRESGGRESRVLHPPVGGDFPVVDWERREDRFVCLGRLHASKRLLEGIEIVRQVRERGHAVTLTLAGVMDCEPAYEAKLRDAVQSHDWLSLVEAPDREELIQLLSRSRYGLHLMHEEHFGMAVAEMQQAGMIVFAPDSGGPPEILDREPAQLWASESAAVEVISKVLGDPDEVARLGRAVQARKDRFSSAQFCSTLSEIVQTFPRSR